MGYRLHVAKKYQVEWADKEAFNWKCEEFHNLLSACGVDYTGESWDSSFEVTKDDWEKAVWKIKNMEILKDDERVEIKKCLESLDSSADETAKILQSFLSLSDPNNGIIYLSFF